MGKKLEPNATLVQRQDLSEFLSIFRFEPDCTLPDAPWFTAGQYMVIGMNNEKDEDLGSVQRPMSIASSPLDREGIEFYIRYVQRPTSDNPLTHLLWPLKEGERAYLRPKPKGKFTLEDLVPERDDRKIVFVGAGTGLAPFVSIARTFEQTDPTRLRNVAIVHGASYPGDLGYRDELQRLEHDHGLVYVPTVSRVKESPDWDGAQGRAEDQFRADNLANLESRLGLAAGEFTPERAVVLVCGLQGTIGMSIERLAARGFVPEQKKLRTAFEVDDSVPPSLFFEQYDSEPVVDLTNEELVGKIRKSLESASG